VSDACKGQRQGCASVAGAGAAVGR
jgi:hypothetical protein